MWLFLLGLAIQGAGGLASLAVARRPASARRVGAGAALVGSVLTVIGMIAALTGRADSAFARPWPVPLGAISLRIDSLASVFLVAIAWVGASSALYGSSYLRKKDKEGGAGPSWFFFNLLLVSMGVVVTSCNAVLFLASWEFMTIASFFLVTQDHSSQEVRNAGWLYLVASHLGAAFLLAFFLMLGNEAGSMDFDAFVKVGSRGGVPSIAFGLAMVGFGVKAGFVPLHIWLPEAHPAAPSHVSALMSGVMIKTGIYGIIRSLAWLGPYQSWWGWTLIVVGLTSGILGVLFALAQHDLKRLLAYHSVENIGIIALGLGVGVVGRCSGNDTMAVMGFGGAILHVLNHALFKGLLFLSAGAVIQATATRSIERLGGLMRTMPRTGAAFLLGSVAIVGLPPLNGFVSELLIYIASFHGAMNGDMEPAGGMALAAGGLALIGGLAGACFAKAFGIVFLGVPRQPLQHAPTDPPSGMRVGMALLGLGCVGIGLGSPLVLRLLHPIVASASSLPPSVASSVIDPYLSLFTKACLVCWIGIGAVGTLWALRSVALSRHGVQHGPTWDCGYTYPTARMQYTASSFASPVLHVFRSIVPVARHAELPMGIFPKASSLETHAGDLWKDRVFAGFFGRVGSLFDRLHWIQHGRVQMYVLYVVVTLVVLLVWKLN